MSQRRDGSGPRPSRRSVVIGAAAAGVTGLVAAVMATTSPDADGEDGVDDGLQSAVDAVVTGGTYTIDHAWPRTRPLAVRHPLTLRFSGGGAIHMTTDQDAIVVTSGRVRIVDPVVTGAGADSAGDAHGIAVLGRRAAPISDVRISGGRLSDLPHDGVHVEYSGGVVVERTTISAVGYAGVALVGVVDATVQDCTVADVRQPARWVNSYGITVTRDATAAVGVTRRSAGVRILRNRVRGVRKWEGIDTHAGDGVEIRDNVVDGCRVGIAAVPSKSSTDRTETDVAPTGLVIAGNRVTRTAALGPGSGIVVSGAGTTVGSSEPRATGSITGNTVVGAGGTDAAGILVKLTRGVRVTGNTITSSVGDALCLEHSNAGITVSGNTITSVSGVSVGIDVRAGANDGEISGNRVTATKPPVRVGLRFGSPDNRFVVRGNSLAAATVSEADDGATITR